MAHYYVLQVTSILLAVFATTHGTFQNEAPVNRAGGQLQLQQQPPTAACRIALDLSNIQMKRLRGGFIKSPFVDSLILQYAEISKIDDSAFTDLTNLAILDLSHNQLSQDQLLTTTNMQNLKTLYLDFNEHEDVDDYPNIAPVKYLYPNLQYLSARSCDIEAIDGSWQDNLPSLQYLDMSDNPLNSEMRFDEYVPPTISNLVIKNASLTKFSTNKLKNLRTADFANNKFEQITSNHEFGEGAFALNYFDTENYLEELTLSDNLIKHIAENAFEYVKGLKILQLENNQIAQFSTDSLQTLPTLEFLDISENELVFVPNFSVCKNLQELNMNYMKKPEFFQNITAEDLDMDNLKILSMEGNNLDYVPPQMFQELQSLEELNMAKNKLKEFAITWDATNLKKLNLQGNAITDLSNLHLSNAEFLESVNIGGNDITSIKAGALREFPPNVAIDYQTVCEPTLEPIALQ